MINHWISKNVGLSRILGEIQENPLNSGTAKHSSTKVLYVESRDGAVASLAAHLQNFRNSYVPKWGTPAKYGSKCSRHPFHCFISNHHDSPYILGTSLSTHLTDLVHFPRQYNYIIWIICILYYKRSTHTSTGRMGVPHVEADINSRGGKAIWGFATMYSLARAATAM